jgi:hypothetical protein
VKEGASLAECKKRSGNCKGNISSLDLLVRPPKTSMTACSIVSSVDDLGSEVDDAIPATMDASSRVLETKISCTGDAVLQKRFND